MRHLRFAIFGAGFWSRFQLAAWHEVGGVECVAIYNRTRSKAEALARQFGVPAVYDDPESLLQHEQIDFVDIITDVDTHSKFVSLATDHRLPVICQKPMAPSLAIAQKMVSGCQQAGVPLHIHENWRWQTPIRQVKRILDEGMIGPPFRARIDMISGFPVFANQPFLKELEQFIITDLGSHTLDVARFLFGEARRLTCQAHRIHADIKGEDVATILLDMDGGAQQIRSSPPSPGAGDGVTVLVEMAYAGTPLERERFPETFIFVEGPLGSIELGPDFWIRVTTAEGTHAKRHPPPRYTWADPAYDVVHASIVPCNANLLAALRVEQPAETTGEDNLKTVRLVFAAYAAAQTHQTIHLRSNTM